MKYYYIESTHTPKPWYSATYPMWTDDWTKVRFFSELSDAHGCAVGLKMLYNYHNIELKETENPGNISHADPVADYDRAMRGI